MLHASTRRSLSWTLQHPEAEPADLVLFLVGFFFGGGHISAASVLSHFFLIVERHHHHYPRICRICRLHVWSDSGHREKFCWRFLLSSPLLCVFVSPPLFSPPSVLIGANYTSSASKPPPAHQPPRHPALMSTLRLQSEGNLPSA